MKLNSIVHDDEKNVKRTNSEQQAIIKRIDKKKDWIIEGTLRKNLDNLLTKADKIIFLDIPVRVRSFRIFKRFIRQKLVMTQLEQEFLEAATRFCRDRNVRNDNNIKEIDWEQRRYEIAKDVLSALIPNRYMSYEQMPGVAVKFADTLIEELKKKNNNVDCQR